MTQNLRLGKLTLNCLKSLTIISLLGLPISTFAQTIVSQYWSNNYSERDQVANLPTAIDANNNVYVTGYTYFSGSYDFTTLKYDPNGNLLWSQHYNNVTNGVDQSLCIALDQSDNVYVAGNSQNANGDRDFTVVKYNAQGVQQWVYRKDGSAQGFDEAVSIHVVNSNEVYVGGYVQNNTTAKDGLLVKLDANGSEVWTQEFELGNNGNENIVGLTGDNNGNVYVAFNEFYNLQNTLHVNSIASNGSVNWTFDKALESEVKALDFNDNLDALVVAGCQKTSGVGNDVYVSLIDAATGNALKEVRKDIYNADDFVSDVKVNTQGDIAITGISDKNGILVYQTLLFRDTLSLEWSHDFSLESSTNMVEPRIGFDSQGNFYISGEFNNNTPDALVYKLGNNGNLVWDYFLNGSVNGTDAAVDIKITDNDEIYFVAQTQNSNAKFDYTTVRLRESEEFNPEDITEDTANNVFAFYENKGQIINTDGDPADEVFFSGFDPDQKNYIREYGVSFVQATYDTATESFNDVQRIDFDYVNSNKPRFLQGENVPMRKNFYLGAVGEGITNVQGHNRIVAKNTYDNIDVQYYNNDNGIKIYFVVNPNGDPNEIEIKVTGATNLFVDNNGDLNVGYLNDTVKYRAPIVYQESNGTNQSLGLASWSLNSNILTISNLPSYDPAEKLTIQTDKGDVPTKSGRALQNLLWSTYWSGGNAANFFEIVNDASGNTYYCGGTNSDLFPADNQGGVASNYAGNFDALVFKVNGDMVPQWVTYYGGSNAFAASVSIGVTAKETAYSITLNEGLNNRIFVVGRTSSDDLIIEDNGGNYYVDPIANGCVGTINEDCQDAFITEFDPNGTLQWATYYGGNYEDFLESVQHTRVGSYLYCGGTRSSQTPSINLAGANNYPDGNGLLMRFTLIDNSTVDQITLDWVNPIPVTKFNDLDADGGGRVYLTGYVSADDRSSFPILNAIPSLPVTSGTATNATFDDAFITSFDANGQLRYSYLYGGSCYDEGSTIAVNQDEDVIVGINSIDEAGLPCDGPSPDIPTFGAKLANSPSSSSIPGGHSEAFLLKMNPYTSGPVSISEAGYFGGGGYDRIEAVKFNRNQEIFITGHTLSSRNNYPVASPAIPFPSVNPAGFYLRDDNQSEIEEERDAFISVFDIDLELYWTTYFGGKNNDYGFDISYSSIDRRLYLIGDTYTYNPLVTPPDVPFELEEFDLNSGNDYFQDVITANYQSFYSIPFATCFEITGLYIGGGTVEIEENNTNEFLLYPNPSKNGFSLKGNISDIQKISVYSISGKLIKQLDGNFNQFITSENWSTGVYIVKIKTADKETTLKYSKI